MPRLHVPHQSTDQVDDSVAKSHGAVRDFIGLILLVTLSVGIAIAFAYVVRTMISA